MMYYFYILESTKDDRLYFGYTSNLRRRLLEHNKGKTTSIKSRRPFTLRYYEAYFSQEDAKQREHSIKNNGRVLAQLKRRISKSLQ